MAARFLLLLVKQGFFDQRQILESQAVAGSVGHMRAGRLRQLGKGHNKRAERTGPGKKSCFGSLDERGVGQPHLARDMLVTPYLSQLPQIVILWDGGLVGLSPV